MPTFVSAKHCYMSILKNNTMIIDYLRLQLEEQDGIIASAEKKKKSILLDIDTLTGTTTANGVKSTKPQKETFETLMEQLLEDGIPKRSREMFPLYVAQKGAIERRVFSSKLTMVCDKKNGKIKKFKFPGADKREQFVFGLSEWFDGKTMKQEYVNKIKKEVVVSMFETATS